MTMAIPVAKRVRDVFYKHRASGMIGHDAMFIGMVVAEMPYLLLMAVLYVFIYCATVSHVSMSVISVVLNTHASFLSLMCVKHKDWPLNDDGEFYVVCLFFLIAHCIVFFLCAVLHVSC
jgi:hypothetical protein